VRSAVAFDPRVAAHRAALVLARLVTRQAIAVDDLTLHRCLEALGVSHDVLVAAVGEVHRNGWPVPSTQPDRAPAAVTELRAALAAAELEVTRLQGLLAAQPSPPDDPGPATRPQPQLPPNGDVAKPGRRGAGYTRTPRRAGEVESKVCPLCPPDAAEHPIDDFQLIWRGRRVDGTKKVGRDTYCIPCRKTLQRSLYLTREKRRQLAAVGVAATVDHPTGLVCAHCGDLIPPTERAATVDVLMHERCASLLLGHGQADELEVAS
jgi:hypothetical protein